MASRNDLSKSAENYLSPYMSEKGFSFGKKTTFFRVNEHGVYHVIAVDLSSSGKYARVFVTATMLEAAEDRDKKDFPCGGLVMYTGGDLGEDGIGAGDFENGLVSTEKQRKDFFSSLPFWLDKWAMPHFEAIQTRQQFWDALDERTKSHFESQGRKNAILCGKKNKIGAS